MANDDYVRTSLSLKDEETFHWVKNYCRLNDISLSEFTERLWRRFRKEHGEVILPAGDYTPEWFKKK